MAWAHLRRQLSGKLRPHAPAGGHAGCVGALAGASCCLCCMPLPLLAAAACWPLSPAPLELAFSARPPPTPTQVVFVSSVMHRAGHLGASPAAFLAAPAAPYAATKLSQVLLAFELQRRMGELGVQASRGWGWGWGCTAGRRGSQPPLAGAAALRHLRRCAVRVNVTTVLPLHAELRRGARRHRHQHLAGEHV